MYFPKYWAKGSASGMDRNGETLTVEAYGWSSESVEDARRRGEERAEKSLGRALQGDHKTRQYEYGHMPFREEIIDTIEIDGREVAVISRNRYGALVLNTAGVMFVDVDLPEPKSEGFIDGILLALSAHRRRERREEIAIKLREDIDRWTGANPSVGHRLYRTRAGYRLLMTDTPRDPAADETRRIFAELRADPLYVKLTERQRCFRARLTPKPWRLPMPAMQAVYPRADSWTEATFKKWEREYRDRSARFATCVLEKAVGPVAISEEVQRVIEFHDALALNQGKPLA